MRTITKVLLAAGLALPLPCQKRNPTPVQPPANEIDYEGFREAYEQAEVAHRGQRRKSGEPYLMHPLRVAESIAGLGLDVASVTAGILHDAVEDSELTVVELAETSRDLVAGQECFERFLDQLFGFSFRLA